VKARGRQPSTTPQHKHRHALRIAHGAHGAISVGVGASAYHRPLSRRRAHMRISHRHRAARARTLAAAHLMAARKRHRRRINSANGGGQRIRRGDVAGDVVVCVPQAVGGAFSANAARRRGVSVSGEEEDQSAAWREW